MKTIKVDIPEKVKIPTSELGVKGNVGSVIEVWNNHIKVNFDGRIGVYSILKHTIIEFND